MSMQKSEKGVKKFTVEEKLAIINEASENGVNVTLAKYDLSPGTYYYWKKKLLVHGEDGLNHRTVKQHQEEIIRLGKENEALKILLAEKQLEGKLKDEMLKKMYPELRKKR
jgi:putative transposase